MSNDDVPPCIIAMFWTLGLSALLLSICLLAWSWLTY
jgi:hypothetical protein